MLMNIDSLLCGFFIEVSSTFSLAEWNWLRLSEQMVSVLLFVLLIAFFAKK